LSLLTALNVMWLGLLLHIAVAFWNSFFGPSFGADIDAAGFHAGAVAYSKGLNFVFYPTEFYTYSLGMIYRWVSDSLLLGSLLSCAAWFASAVVLLKMMRLLSLSAYSQFQAMFIYALLPSAILITSVTLREAYQLLALNLAVYSALRIYMNQSMVQWALLLLAVTLLGLLHYGLLVVGILIAFIAGISTFFKRYDRNSVLKLTFFLAISAIAVYIALVLLLSIVHNEFNGLAAALQSRQDSWQKISRAYYSIGVKIASDSDILLFIPAALFHYLFQPMPWHITQIADFGLFLENMLRAFLLWKVLLNLYQLPSQRRAPVLVVFVCYLITETLWAVGTINWGTAARHHVPSLGLLVLAAYAGSEGVNRAPTPPA
jgi:hypothetical protein